MRITPLIVGVLLLAVSLAAGLATAQAEYDWSFRTREQRFGENQAVARSTQRADTHVRVRIDRLDEHTLEVTVVSLRMSVLDTPAGVLEFDSAGEPDPRNVLEAGLRPLVGMSYTLRHDPETGLVEASGELIEMPASKALIPMTISPWSTPCFMPFFLEGRVMDEADELPEFRVVPVVMGEIGIGELAPITYSFEREGTRRVLVLSHDEQFKDIKNGFTTEMEIENMSFQLAGSGRAVMEELGEGVGSFEYTGTTELAMDFAPSKPMRSVVKVSLEVTRVVEVEMAEPETESVKPEAAEEVSP